MSDSGTICVYEASIRYRRLGRKRAPLLLSPEAVVAYMEGAFDEDPTVEWFYVILLNIKNRPMGRVLITRGVANATLVQPREVLRPAILANAPTIVAVHNHPLCGALHKGCYVE